MPVARCAACGPPSRKFSAKCLSAEPLGHPRSALVCGVAGCENSALLWLTAWEVAEFRDGRRIFNISGRSPKVQLGEQTRPARQGSEKDCIAANNCRKNDANRPFMPVLRALRELMDVAGAASLMFGRAG